MTDSPLHKLHNQRSVGKQEVIQMILHADSRTESRKNPQPGTGSCDMVHCTFRLPGYLCVITGHWSDFISRHCVAQKELYFDVR